MVDNIAILDIGKSNAKLSLVDKSNGDLLLTDSVATRICSEPFYPHLDTEYLWRWIVAALKSASQQFDINTIAVTAHGATAALIDDQALVLPILDYEHKGPDELRDSYNQLCDAFEYTYSPKLAAGLNIGRQLFWQQQRFPEQFAKIHFILPYAQYWSWRLTGIPVAEITSVGSHTDLWRPQTRSFSNFAEQAGFAKMLPGFMSCDSVLGKLKPEICLDTGISEQCEVLVGIHDSNASLVPYLKTRELPFTVMSTGTWVIIFALGAELEAMVAERDCAANVNIYSDPVACGRFMGGREFALVASGVASGVANRVAAEQVAEEEAEDGHAVGTEEELQRILDEGIFALPAFTEIGGAFPDSEGLIIADRPLTPRERYSLASLYCALLSDVSLSLCQAQGDIIVEGAYAQNAMLLTCLQVFRPEQRVFASSDNTGTTLGTAMLVSEGCSPPKLNSVVKAESTLCDSLLRYRDQWQQLSNKHAFGTFK